MASYQRRKLGVKVESSPPEPPATCASRRRRSGRSALVSGEGLPGGRSARAASAFGHQSRGTRVGAGGWHDKPWWRIRRVKQRLQRYVVVVCLLAEFFFGGLLVPQDFVEPPGCTVVYEATNPILQGNERTGADASNGLADILFEVSKRFQRERRPYASVGLDRILECVVSEGQHSAVSVVGQHDLLGSKQALRDDERANCVVADHATGARTAGRSIPASPVSEVFAAPVGCKSRLAFEVRTCSVGVYLV